MSRILPILFNTAMVRAILDGRKTVTRRLVKKSQAMLLNKVSPNELLEEKRFKPFDDMQADDLVMSTYKPKYRQGDVLYVRETWSRLPASGMYIYKADNAGYGESGCIKWHPSIHMPREAARIWLEIKDVRAERIQNMGLEDFTREGVVLRPEAFNDPENAYWQARRTFTEIWDSTIRKPEIPEYGFESNPWVWVIEFGQCEKLAGHTADAASGRIDWR